METKNARVFKPGDHVKIVRTSATKSDMLNERDMNEVLDKLREDAYGAGFLMSAKSIAYDGVREAFVVLYELRGDPAFRPPV